MLSFLQFKLKYFFHCCTRTKHKSLLLSLISSVKTEDIQTGYQLGSQTKLLSDSVCSMSELLFEKYLISHLVLRNINMFVYFNVMLIVCVWETAKFLSRLWSCLSMWGPYLIQMYSCVVWCGVVMRSVVWFVWQLFKPGQTAILMKKKDRVKHTRWDLSSWTSRMICFMSTLLLIDPVSTCMSPYI